MSDNRPDIMFVTYAVPDDYATWLFAQDPIPGTQSNIFAHNMVAGLEQTNRSIFVLSTAPAQDYPMCPVKTLHAASLDFPAASGFVFAVSNKPVRKRIGRFVKAVWHTILRRPRMVLIHGTYLPYLVFACLVRCFGIKIGIVLTDPSGVVLASDTGLRAFLKQIDRSVTKVLYQGFNFGIALAPKLAQTCIPGKPVLIVPGIFDDTQACTMENDPSRALITNNVTDRLTIGYFGGIMAGYGPVELARHIMLSDLDVAFHIWGNGPEVHQLQDMAAADDRIVYNGFIARADALSCMEACDVLVNPRMLPEQVSRQSFPSKIFEYALARKPVLTTPLGELPDEVATVLQPLDMTDVTTAAASLQSLLTMKPETRRSVGAQTFETIQKFYSPKRLGHDLNTFLMTHDLIAQQDKMTKAPTSGGAS